MKKLTLIFLIITLLTSCVKQEVTEDSKTTVSETSVTTQEVTTKETITTKETTPYTDTYTTTTEAPQKQKYRLLVEPEVVAEAITNYIEEAQKKFGERTIKEIIDSVISDFNYTQEGKTDEEIIGELLDRQAVCFLVYRSQFMQLADMPLVDAFKTYQNFEKLMYATYTKDFAKELLENGFRNYDVGNSIIYSGPFFYDDNGKFGIIDDPVNFGYYHFWPYANGYDFTIDSIAKNTCEVTLSLSCEEFMDFYRDGTICGDYCKDIIKLFDQDIKTPYIPFENVNFVKHTIVKENGMWKIPEFLGLGDYENRPVIEEIFPEYFEEIVE